FRWLTLSPDGRTLITGGTNGIIIWDTINWQKVRTLSGPGLTGERAVSDDPFERPQDLAALAFSPDGTMLAAGVYAKQGVQIRLWNISKLLTAGSPDSPAIVCEAGRGAVTFLSVCLNFSPDSRALTTSTTTAAGHLLQLWEVKTGKLV